MSVSFWLFLYFVNKVKERSKEVWGDEDKLEQAKEDKLEKREQQKQKKFDKKVKGKKVFTMMALDKCNTFLLFWMKTTDGNWYRTIGHWSPYNPFYSYHVFNIFIIFYTSIISHFLYNIFRAEKSCSYKYMEKRSIKTCSCLSKRRWRRWRDLWWRNRHLDEDL